MITDHIDGGLRAEVLVEAPSSHVFPYLAEPDKLVTWMGTKLRGDISVGRPYRLDFFGDSRYVAAGEFTAVDPPDRIELTWGWEGTDEVKPGSSTVTIELSDVDAGTRVVLTHTGLPEGSVAEHIEGWEQHLGRLAIAGTGKDPGPYGSGAG